MQRHTWNETNPNVCPHSLWPIVELPVSVLPKHADPYILDFPLELCSGNSHDNNHMHAEPPSASFLEVRPIGGGPVMWSVMPSIQYLHRKPFATTTHEVFLPLPSALFHTTLFRRPNHKCWNSTASPDGG
jgi:hypothetical protein